MLSQSGVLASSKSASHTLAPEFSALIVIFLSVGPVISTRRSIRPGAGGATRQEVSLRIASVLVQEVERAAGRQLVLAPGPGLQQLVAALAELAVQHGYQVERLGGQDLVVPAAGRAGNLNATRHRTLLTAAATGRRDGRCIDTRR